MDNNIYILAFRNEHHGFQNIEDATEWTVEQNVTQTPYVTTARTSDTVINTAFCTANEEEAEA
jgi:hypothetical protein